MGDLTGLLFPLMVLAVFYFFMIRPQAKKQRLQREFINQLKKGDRVVTNSGLIGKISKVEPNIVTLQVGQKVFLDFYKGSISREMTDLLPKLQSNEVVEVNPEK